MIRALAVMVVGLALLGCSSDNDTDEMLHLRTGDFTESEWREEVRADLVAGSERCDSIKGLSVSEIVALEDSLQERGDFTPSQSGVDNDRERAAEIVKEECERITG